MKKSFLVTLAILVIPYQAWAHERHGTPGQGNTVSHYILDPLHLLLALVTLARYDRGVE